MICLRLLILLFFLSPVCLPAQTETLFDENRVASIYLDLPDDSLQEMITLLVNDRYYRCRFIFDDGNHRDTVEQTGLRLRGNTSLNAQKKSFKLSFNEFVADREYQGVRKLNLRGSANDPTMIREKLFYEASNNAGLANRRSAFVKLYINNEYRGLYTNIEEIDKQWLARVFGNNDGNLYKCTWPADLAYISDNQSAYKAILNNPETRAYDLVTNETADDYTRFIACVKALNQPVTGAYVANISAILNVESVLKSFALDVATGNWDDYFYNKNNYYLYDNPVTGRFEFITFDTDNTFGIDWVGKDWAKRNCLQWLPAQQSRPLATKLLSVNAFYNRYVHYLDSLTRHVLNPGIIFPKIDEYHQLITAAALADQYRTLDFGYDVSDFHNGFTQTVDNHCPYGIKPFLGMRYDSTLRQIAHLVSDTDSPDPAPALSVYPNPAGDYLTIETTAFESKTVRVAVVNVYGQCIFEQDWATETGATRLDLSAWPTGWYRVRIQGQSGEAARTFFHLRD